MSSRKGFGKGRSPSKFSFTYEDYSAMSGLSIEAVRKHAQRGNFNPRDLMSVLEFVQRQAPVQEGYEAPSGIRYPRVIAKIARRR